MSTADALLRAVIDRPDDDLPRLAYADALEEAGDVARAEFVRVQVELARRTDHDPARPALEDREHDLLAAHEAVWLGDAGSAVEWHWHRGFVEEVAASPGWMLDHGDELFAAHPTRRWRVMPGGSDDRDAFGRVEKARWAGRLEAFDVTARGPLDVGASQFLVLADLARLRELELVSTGIVIGGLQDLLRAAPPRDRLTVLRCDGISGRPVDPMALAAALPRTRLIELSIPNTGLTADGLRHLLAAPCCRELTSLDVRDNDLMPDAWEAFRDAPCRLRELDLSGTSVGAPGLDRVLRCDSAAELRSLELNRYAATAEGLLAGSPFWRQAEELRMHGGATPYNVAGPLLESTDGPADLWALDLSVNALEDAGVAALAATDWCGSLVWLGLGYNYLTDDAARTIAGSGRFTRLRTLLLGQNVETLRYDGRPAGSITSAGVCALAESPGLANLRLLDLYTTRTDAGGMDAALNGPHWRLAGLGLAECGLDPAAVRVLAASPRLWRLGYLDLSGHPWLGEDVLMPLAESPYLCPLLELDIRGVPASDRVRAALRERLGRRLSE